MPRVVTWALSGWFALSVAGVGQSLVLEVPGGAAGRATKAGTECTGGIRYDDGTFEFGFGFQPDVALGRYASQFILPGTVNRLDAVCLFLAHKRSSTQSSFDAIVEIWSDVADAPGILLGSFPASFTGVPSIDQGFASYRVNLPLGFAVDAKRVFLGLSWAPTADANNLLIAADGSDPDLAPAYVQTDEGGWRKVMESVQLVPALLGIRTEASGATPPVGPWLATTALQDFRFKVRITPGAQQIVGVLETDCVPETLCVSGAVPGRSEVFVRIVGPRPNGFLWPSIVKLTVSQVEVWIEQLSSGQLRYYKLPAQGPGDMTLPGLVDREAFEP